MYSNPGLFRTSLARHTPPKGEGLVKRYWTRCVACQEYGQTNQIAVCVHVAKAYALRGIEAAEYSSATNLGCSNLREKQKEAIILFVTGKDVLVQLQLPTKVSLLLFVAMATVRISHSCDTTRSITFYQTLSLGWGVACETNSERGLFRTTHTNVLG